MKTNYFPHSYFFTKLQPKAEKFLRPSINSHKNV